ncbi:MAG: hypothetical protein L3J01_03615 [Thiomicrorhabdus sp.]|nr:hypothetical protein [Thiomicrorhabdus sp.]
MRLAIGVILATVCLQSLAVEGYKDIYLDRETPVNVHSIYCGKNLKNLRILKAAYIYTNTENIEKGTYYYTSQYGRFSYTFNAIPGRDPTQILARGLLASGKTKKSDMVKDVCIVGKIQGLPKKLSDGIGKKVLSVEDPEWDAMMAKYGFFGKPAFGKGVYKDSRTVAKHGAHDQKIYDANQAYLKKSEALFSSKFKTIALDLPKQLEAAVQYAYQEDGFIKNKVYPTINKPTVWTKVSKDRYETQQRHLSQMIDFDKVIQSNFDWFFKLTTKGNKLKSVKLLNNSKPKWNGQILEQIATIRGTFEDEQSLELDFLISSEKLLREIFYSLEEVKKAAVLVRNSAIMGSRKPIAPIVSPSELRVYSNAEKTIIFFSPFRAKKLNETYRRL